LKAYEPRLIDALIDRKLKSAGAAVLRGSRAVGKTTSALHHAASSVRVAALLTIEDEPEFSCDRDELPGRDGRQSCHTATSTGYPTVKSSSIARGLLHASL
jgi:hypothetical protein